MDFVALIPALIMIFSGYFLTKHKKHRTFGIIVIIVAVAHAIYYVPAWN